MFEKFIEDSVPANIIFGDVGQQTIGYSQPTSPAASCIPVTSPEVAGALELAQGYHGYAQQWQDAGQAAIAKIFEQAATSFLIEAKTFSARDRSLAELAANTPAEPNDANMGTIDVGDVSGGSGPYRGAGG